MKNLEQLKKDFEREFLEDDLGNNFAFTNKDNKVLINYEELWNWITKNFCPVEPEVSQENCVWEILSKNGDSFYIILADCQKPHTMADSLFATTIYKYCPHCGRKLKSKLSSNFSG